MKNVVNLDELDLQPGSHGERFAWRTAQVSRALGAKDLGYSYDVLPPGKAGCPFHSHRGEEEMFFILRGSGTLRYGAARRRVRAGDFICCPTGGPETAHQLINDSDEELAYISVSTNLPVEVCEYPDSGKVAAFGGAGDGRLRHITESAALVDYWKGE